MTSKITRGGWMGLGTLPDIERVERVALAKLRDTSAELAAVRAQALDVCAELGLPPADSRRAIEEAIAEVMGEDALPYVLALLDLQVPEASGEHTWDTPR